MIEFTPLGMVMIAGAAILIAIIFIINIRKELN